MDGVSGGGDDGLSVGIGGDMAGRCGQRVGRGGRNHLGHGVHEHPERGGRGGWRGGGQVWVAAGTYTSAASPVVGMADNVAIYGGFAGNESADQFDLRDPQANVTLIDGESARRGVTGANNAIIDGFTITRCVPTTTSWGAGMQCQDTSPTISNCTFQANAASSGGGLGLSGSAAVITDCRFLANDSDGSGAAGMYASISTATIVRCLFAGNYSDGNGGGVTAWGSLKLPTNLTFSDCTFASNEAWQDGAGVYMAGDSAATFSGCRFVGNEISGEGGGISSEDGHLTILNCVFTGNTSLYGGAIAKWSDGELKMTNCTLRRNWCHAGSSFSGGNIYGECDSATITNCILWEGQKDDGTPNEMDFYATIRSYSYNNVAGGLAGTANIDADPLFQPGYLGTISALAYDAAACQSTVTIESGAFLPGTLTGQLLQVAPVNPYDPPCGYLIVANDATTITVWADVTRGGSVTAPRACEVLNWRLQDASPCLDTGRDASESTYGAITTDIDGDARGYDGLNDGPTGPPEPGDGSDYDMGADELIRLPDLAVSAVTLLPAAPLPDEEFTIQVTVLNVGLGNAGPSVLSIELTGDATPLTYPVPALDAGESYVVPRLATLPEGEDYSVTAIADAEGDVPTDPNPANNALTRVFDVSVPAFHTCDIDRDGDVDAVDVQLVINAALSLDIGGFDADVDDLNGVSAVDVQMVINAALGIL